MDEIMALKQQLEDNYRLLKENNVLLREIMKQNQLISEITVETIWFYSGYHYWPELEKITKMRKELKNLYETIAPHNEK